LFKIDVSIIDAKNACCLYFSNHQFGNNHVLVFSRRKSDILNRIFVRKHESIMLSALKICILKRGTTISYRLIEPEKGERMFSDLNLLIFDKLTLKAFCFRGGRQQGEWALFIRNRV
jgi:hypothetical protein